ncbi:MAG: restriction endonuclease subunit S [Pseudonocardiaceae bacterium]
MTDLPPGWEWARLDQVAEVRLGRQRSPKNHTGNQMRPYLRAANVGWQGLRLDDIKLMNFTDEETKIYRLEYGDIIVAEASGSPGEVGKPALWRGEIDGCCIQNTLIRIRGLGTVEPSYLLYFIRAEALRGSFAARTRGVGIHHLGSGLLAEWLIPVPPLAEQRRIVKSIESNFSRIEVGSRYASLARSRFAEFRHSELIKLRDFAVEKSVTLSPLCKVSDTSLGKMLDAKKNSGTLTPYLRNANVQWGRFSLGEVLHVPMSKQEVARLRLKKGDLMVCEGGQPGRCAVWQDSERLMTYQKALHRVRPHEGVLAEWLSLMIEEAVRSGRTAEMLTGTTIKHLPQVKLRQLLIPVPDYAIQRQLVEIFDMTASRCKNILAGLDLIELRTKCLQRSLFAEAFAGELVPQDPNDEPMSVLLHRTNAQRAAQKTNRGRHTPEKPDEQGSLL